MDKWEQPGRLNAPTGAWCSLTAAKALESSDVEEYQCTYRCVVLPDMVRIVVYVPPPPCLNAPTGAWCSLTLSLEATEGP